MNNSECNTMETIESLKGLITRDVAQVLYEAAERNEILSKYIFPTKPGGDGIYRIWVKDDAKKTGRKQLSSKSLDSLKDKVFKYEKGQLNSTRKTFAQIFEIVEYLKLHYSKKDKKKCKENTVSRDKSSYDRYIKGSIIEHKYIDTITKKDIEAVIFNNLEKYDLRMHAFNNLRGTISRVFKYAAAEHMISFNPYLDIDFDKYENMILDDDKIRFRAHSDEEFQAILAEVRAHQQKKPDYMPAYALELLMIMSSRPGEIPPLNMEDVQQFVINIEKEQILVRPSNGEPCYYAIVHNTKTHKDRAMPRYNALNNFLDRLFDALKKYYPDSKYLFPDPRTETGVITGNALYCYYRRVCKKLGIEISAEHKKGLQSFRRNGSTDIINLSGGNSSMESDLLGHSVAVAENNYFTGAKLQQSIQVLNMRNL